LRALYPHLEFPAVICIDDTRLDNWDEKWEHPISAYWDLWLARDGVAGISVIDLPKLHVTGFGVLIFHEYSSAHLDIFPSVQDASR